MEGIFHQLIDYALVAFIIAALIAFTKWAEYAREKKLRDLVAWSVTGDYCPALGQNSFTRELLLKILNSQFAGAVEPKYRITEEFGKQYIREIIEEYQRDLSRSYFRGLIKLPKSKYEIPHEDFFMMTLYDFLAEHQCDAEFLKYEMRKERLEYKHHGDWEGSLCDATYSLTDFAVVYHKLYYISYKFCKNSRITNPNESPNWYDWVEKSLKEILDNNQIQISRY